MTSGDKVRIRLAGDTGDWCEATVALASGTAAAFTLDGAVRVASGGFVLNVLPVFVEDGRVTALWGDEYEVEVQA